MPIVDHPNGSFSIPFDPDVIAQYMYNGIVVNPDPGTPGPNFKTEQDLINNSLRSLWQDKNVKTNPVRKNEQPGTKFMDLPASNFRNVQPNPTIKFQLRDIDPTPVNKALPKTWETKAPIQTKVNLADISSLILA